MFQRISCCCSKLTYLRFNSILLHQRQCRSHSLLGIYCDGGVRVEHDSDDRIENGRVMQLGVERSVEDAHGRDEF